MVPACPCACLERGSLGGASGSDADFILLFELRARRSGKFWSTVTMETSDLREEERASPALATARCHQEDPASPGAEVGRVACPSAAHVRATGRKSNRRIWGTGGSGVQADVGYRRDCFCCCSTCSVLGLPSRRHLKTFPCGEMRAEPFSLPPLCGDPLGDIQVTRGT